MPTEVNQMNITTEEWRAIKNLGDEATKVATFLQRRGHNPDEACAVMGVALAQLIDNRGMLESFIEALRAEYRIVRGLVRLAAVLLMTLSATPAAAIDFVDCSMVIGHLNVCGENDKKILPPKEYDHPFQGTVVEIIATEIEQMAIACAPNPLAAKAMGCAAKVDRPEYAYPRCYVFIAPDWYLKKNRVTLDAVRRHEIAHCNGWPQSHPQMGPR